MRKQKIMVILAGLVLILLFNPYSLDYIKNQFTVSTSDLAHSIPFAFSNNNYASSFRGNLLTYDGLTLNLIDQGGMKVFDITINADNYSISHSENEIFILDLAKKNVFVLDEKGRVINQVKVDDMPRRVVALKGGGFLIHYFTDVYVEGVKVFSKRGKQVKDIAYPNVTLTLIESVDAEAFMVMGFFRNSDSLDNSVYYYTDKGELQFATQLNNSIISKVITQKDKFLMLGVSSVLSSDKMVEEHVNFEFTEELKDMVANEKGMYVLTFANSIKLLNYEFQSMGERSSQEDIQGLLLHQGELLYYTKDSLFYGSITKQYSKDILQVIDLGKKLAVIFKGEIQILTLNERR